MAPRVVPLLRIIMSAIGADRTCATTWRWSLAALLNPTGHERPAFAAIHGFDLLYSA
jgi:hypothetical protein